MILPILRGGGDGDDGSGTMRDNGAIHSLGEQWVRSAKELHVYICQVGPWGPRCQEERRTLSVSSLRETFLLPSAPLRPPSLSCSLSCARESDRRDHRCVFLLNAVPCTASWKGAMGGPTCCPWEPMETRVPHQTPPWLRARLTNPPPLLHHSACLLVVLRERSFFSFSYSSYPASSHFSRHGGNLTGFFWLISWFCGNPLGREKNRYDDIISRRQVYLEFITRESKSCGNNFVA